LPRGALAWTGPFDPDADADWQSFQSGDITERDYWDLQVARFAELTGLPAEMPVMMGYLYSGTQEQLVRPAARALIRDAQRAGRPVGMLTNDLTAFHDQEWIDRMTVIAEFDAMVDGRSDGVLKPDPAAYLLMCERLGVDPGDVVFIDDQPVNLAGARALGLQCVHLDPTNPEPGFVAARELLQLPAPA
jgi:putative hydrolase of the HAD superfamily